MPDTSVMPAMSMPLLDWMMETETERNDADVEWDQVTSADEKAAGIVWPHQYMASASAERGSSLDHAEFVARKCLATSRLARMRLRSVIPGMSFADLFLSSDGLGAQCYDPILRPQLRTFWGQIALARGCAMFRRMFGDEPLLVNVRLRPDGAGLAAEEITASTDSRAIMLVDPVADRRLADFYLGLIVEYWASVLAVVSLTNRWLTEYRRLVAEYAAEHGEDERPPDELVDSRIGPQPAFPRRFEHVSQLVDTINATVVFASIRQGWRHAHRQTSEYRQAMRRHYRRKAAPRRPVLS